MGWINLCHLHNNKTIRNTIDIMTKDNHPEPVLRVINSAKAAGLKIKLMRFAQPANTAAAAAELVGCTVGQIANSLVFEGVQSAGLYLLLTSGAHRVALDKAGAQIGEPLKRAKPDRIKDELGFVIGGVAPLGFLQPIPSYIDRTLFDFDRIWAAAGISHCVFETTAQDLARACKATTFDAH